MKSSKKYLFIGLGMLLIVIVFIKYALGHPEASFPLPLEFTYLIYIAYLGFTIYFVIKGLKKINKKI